MANNDYLIEKARYAKNCLIIKCKRDEDNHLKTRAMRLLSGALKARWSNREKGYIVSINKAVKFKKLYEEGWDACVMSSQLIAKGDI